MTFKRDFLHQRAFPQLVITNVLLFFFMFVTALPPYFTFYYGLGVNLINLLMLAKSVWAKNKTDFDYTISCNNNQLQISLASGETHIYNMKTLQADKDDKYFWIQDGETKHTYPYNSEVIAFLDQLE